MSFKRMDGWLADGDAPSMFLMTAHIQFDNTYARELEGTYVPWQPAKVPLPEILRLNTSLRHTNPLYIPRNHRVEEALAAATDHADLAPFDRLLNAVTRPFEEDPELDTYASPAPAEVTACYQTFCGT